MNPGEGKAIVIPVSREAPKGADRRVKVNVQD